MKITDADETWRSFTTASKEILYVETGSLRIDTEAVEGERSGLPLKPGESFPLAAAETVYYKRGNSGVPVLAARIALK